MSPKRPRSSRRELVDLLVISGLVTLTAWAAVRWIKPLHAVEDWISDFRISVFSPPEPQHPDIVVLTITEETLRGFQYRSPVQRKFLADLLDFLGKTGVRAVGIDLLFDQGTQPEYDEALREALVSFPAPLVTAYADGTSGMEDWQLDFQKEYLDGVAVGLVNMLKDDDGLVRRIYPGEREGGMPSFPYALAKALGRPTPERSVRLAYRGSTPGEPEFLTLDAHSLVLLPPAFARRLVSGKTVLLGTDLPQSDRHPTPLGRGRPNERSTPGVLIHAHALGQLLDGRTFPKMTPAAAAAFLLLLAVLGALSARWEIPLALKIVWGLAILLALGAAGCVLYRRGGPMIPVFLHALGFLGSFLVAGIYLAGRRKVAERFIRRAFGQYLSPKVIQRLIDDPQALQLGGEKREMSFVFSDIAGFTTLSENLPAERLASLLQSYLGGMVKIALAHDGTIDKFIGDAVVVIFGAPADQPDHAQRAVQCALEMDLFAEGFRESQQSHGVEFGVTRIGVHTGVATVGNLGAESRFDYTAIGDVVNTAARLEAVNKHLGTRVCISRDAARHSTGLRLRPVGDIVLKGKDRGIAVLSPSSRGDSPETAAEDYQRAFDALRGDNGKAMELFRELRGKYPQDELIAFHGERLARGETGVRIVMKDK